MPKPDVVAGTPIWVELYSSDTAKSRAFYGELFGWTSEEPNEALGGYLNFQRDGERIGGCMGNDGQSGMPDVWSVYLATDDIDKVAEGVTTNGGSVIAPPMAVADLGSMAVFSDPGGAVVGAWQPGTHAGCSVVAEPGSPGWFELHTRDYDTSVEFYRQAFGWDAHVMSDVAEFRYTTLREGEEAQAGIMDASSFLPDGAPAQWSTYFHVDDVDATLAKAVELGATVVDAPEDTPYGRLATATDVTGACFKLHGDPTG
ncbi:MAG: VOC family protein [Acidimicrobiia bacterium]|nr:VOC family protein [Acidimicrobiia bacterium]